MAKFDVDIDVNALCDKERYGTRAMIYNEKAQTVTNHPSGYYIQCAVPIDLVTGACSIDYKEMDSLGYQKVDILTNSSYDIFRSKDEVLEFFYMDPPWERLKEDAFIKKLPHLADNVELVKEVLPQSVQELADVLALLRPGKTHLIASYLEDKEKTRKNLYRRPVNGGMYFKLSHSIGYASMVVCVMNKLHYGVGVITS